MRGKLHEALDFPSMPNIFTDVYKKYSDLHGSEITYQELKAYTDLMGVKITPLEIDIIKDIEHVRKCAINEMSPQKILEVFNYG